MHIPDVDLNLFVVFDAIYAEGGVSRACSRLNLTQPAVSHALGRLRLMFNDPLFVRRQHVMTPTPLAREIISTVRQSLNGFETTLNQTSRFDPATTRKKFVIGLRNNIEAPFLSTLVTAIAASAPHIDIASVRFERHKLQRELSAGILDAAVDGLLPLSNEVRREPVLTERLVVFARNDHPELRTSLNADTYLRMEHVCVMSRRSGISFEDFELQRLGVERNIRLQCQNFATACHVVGNSDMLLTCSDHAASASDRPLPLRAFPCPFEVGPHVNYLYWHSNTESDPANQWLRAQLIAVGKTLARNSSSKSVAKRRGIPQSPHAHAAPAGLPATG